MKLDYCQTHRGAPVEDAALPCLAIRHDDGRRATQRELWAEIERLRAENARLAREAHTWWTALAGATAEIEQWRRSAERCVTAWTVVRGGVWDPNGLMDEHMAALRKALGPNA